MFHNALEIFRADVVAVECVGRDGDPGNAIVAINLECAQGVSQQRQSTG
jgi:hypothetical protein